RITIQTTMVPSSSIRMATTSKSFVTKHRLNSSFILPRGRRGGKRWGFERLEQLEPFEPNSSRPCHSMFEVPGLTRNPKLGTRNHDCPSLGGANHDLNQSARR